MVYGGNSVNGQLNLMKKLRLEIDNGRCVLCENKAGIDVYHKSKVKSIGESIHDFVTLCSDCYEKRFGNAEKAELSEIKVQKYYGDLVVENPLLVPGNLVLDGEYVTYMGAKSKVKINNIEVGEHLLSFRYKMHSIKTNVIVKDGMTAVKKLLIPRKIVKSYYEDLEYEFLEICNAKTPDYHRLREIMSVDGFDIQVKTDYSGESPVHLAVRNGNLELVDFLVQNCADINAANIKNRTPITVACAIGEYDIFKYLLDSGAATEVLDVCGDSLLIKVINSEKRDFGIFETLVKIGADINYKNEKEGDTPLTRALKFAPDEYVDYLIENGADLFVEDKIGENPLDIAVEHARCKYYQMFLEKGLRPSKKHTIIQLAKRNLFELLKDAIDGGADVDSCEIDGSTALIEAVKVGNLDMVDYLLKKGASLEIEDNKGDTAIYYSESEEIIEKLLDSGLNINHKNKEGKTVVTKFLEKYMDRKEIEILKIYLEKGAEI